MLAHHQIRQFQTDGYAVVPDLIPTQILDRVKDEYANLIGPALCQLVSARYCQHASGKS